MVDSRVYPGLERVPGVQNWVDRAKGLPDYIERIAKHLHYEKGMSISRAIATAVNTVKRWARMGKVAKYGDPHHKHVSAKTAALAAKAVAEWYAKRAAGKIHLSEAEFALIDLTEVSDEFALELADEILDGDGNVIDLADAQVSKSDTMVALMIPPKVADKIAIDGGVPPKDLHLTLTFHGETTPEQYQQICQDLAAWAADGGPGELAGHIGGLGQFPPSEAGAAPPHFAPADVPGLNALHEQVKAVTEKVAPASKDHGYTPHVTLGYQHQPPAPVPNTPVQFSSMHVVRGNRQRTEIPLGGDTRGLRTTSAGQPRHGRLRAGEIKLTEGGMDRGLLDLADRASRIKDPAQRAQARRYVINLAVNPSAEQRRKFGMADGSFPVWNADSLESAINLARTPAQRRHIIRRARALGLSPKIPGNWSMSLSELAMEGLLDLASTIPPKNAHGRVSDGRRSYKSQGHWKHGFVPVDGAAKESKAKGSPIAIKRLNRLFGAGRAGQRSGGKNKVDPATVNVDEKHQPGAESAKSIAALRSTQFTAGNKKQSAALPKQQLESSKSSRIPDRARQNWDEIPDNLKTVRNGVRYVYAEFGQKGFVTPWVGGVQEVAGTSLDKRKVYATLSSQTAAAMTPAQLRDVVANPRSPARVKKVARQALRDMAKEPSRG